MGAHPLYSALSQRGLLDKIKPTYNQKSTGSPVCMHLCTFNDPFSRSTLVSQYQKGKTNLDFTEATDSECQWHQLVHMQVCTSLQTDNHASTPLLTFFTGRMPFLLLNQQRQSTEGTEWIACSNSKNPETAYSIEGNLKLKAKGRCLKPCPLSTFSSLFTE